MSNLIIPNEAAQTLRPMAASLGFKIRRGLGAGEIGNLSELIEAIADAYKIDPDSVVVLVEQIMLINHKEAERWTGEQIKEHGVIII